MQNKTGLYGYSDDCTNHSGTERTLWLRSFGDVSVANPFILPFPENRRVISVVIFCATTLMD